MLVQIKWVPSHLNMEGSDGTDKLAPLGRGQHLNNQLPLSKRRRVTEWVVLGRESMALSDR